MKKFIPLILILFFSLSLFAQSDDTSSVVKSRKTRGITLEEVYRFDSTHSIFDSPLFESFDSIGIAPVKRAYRLNRLVVDSLLAADSLNPNFWRVYSYQAVNVFKQANQSPQMAMSLLLPWFLVVFVLIVIVRLGKLLFVHVALADPVKPENDHIKKVDDEPEVEEAGTSDDEGGPAGQD